VRDITRKYSRVRRSDSVQIVEMNALGKSQRFIAKTLGLSRSVVRRVIVDNNDHDVCTDLPRSGRRSKFDDRAVRLVGRIIDRGEATTATAAHQILTRDHNLNISVRSVRNLLHQQGLHVRHATRRPLLTREHKRVRYEFALAHQDWTVDQWKQVVFSDETVITSNHLDSRHLVWTRDVDPLDPRLIVESVQGGGAKIMVWGCISWYGVHDLILLEGSVNAEGYIGVLEENLLPIRQQYFGRRSFIFQQDGARIHTANATMEFLNDQNIEVLEWPAHSPDLNIIENVWRYRKVKLYKLQPSANAKELWVNVFEVMEDMWADEMTQRVQNLFESMPRRMAAVIRARGKHTKY
jgi:transposase